MTEGGAGAGDRAERLASDARASAEALLDWLGPRLDDARTGSGPSRAGHAGAAMADRPPQSAGPCSWCPVCALVAALRGEQPELTARLAEQASGLVVLVRLLLEGHGAHHHAPPPGPDPARHRAEEADGPAEEARDGGLPVDVVLDDTERADRTDRTDGADPPDLRGPGERPTGRRSPRPSPRLRSVPPDDEGPDAGAARPGPPSPGAASPGPASPGAASAAPPAHGTRGPGPRRRPDVQRIPVRRVPPGPC